MWNAMSSTRTNKTIIVAIILVCMFLVNYGANVILHSEFKLSIYDPAYDREQALYIKHLGNKVHPFYGLASNQEVGFDSDLSIEKSFLTVSKTESKNPIKILVLGGSVASNLSLNRLDVESYLFTQRLNEYFETDRFVVYNAGFGGGKQPQQYFKLLYLDLLGFSPDIIINYDGFNEVALPFAENLNFSLNAIYPRQFDSLVAGSAYDGSCFELNNKLLSFNSYIPLVELVKWIYVRRCHNTALGQSIFGTFSDQQLFQQERTNYLKHVKLIWERSSNLINEFAKNKNIPYIHVVQPNQYLPGSKILSDLEIRDFGNNEPFKNAIKSYYSKLDIFAIESDHKIDQRFLFKDEKRTVYSDACCHFNRLGMITIINNIILEASPVFEQALANN